MKTSGLARFWRQYAFRVLLALLVVFPLLAGVYYAFVAPRPYPVMQTDIEADYYYNAKRLLAGQEVIGTYHPGTLVYYLGALLMKATSADVHQAQSFFNAAYIVVSVVSVVAVGGGAWFLRRCGIPAGVAGLCLACMTAWPPFLAYLNYFGSDAFVVAAGFPATLLLWENMRRYRRGLVVALGLATGVCLSIKLTFIPWAVAAGLATSVQVVRRERWWWIGALPVATVGAFALCTWPVLEYMWGVVVFTVFMRGRQPVGQIANLPSEPERALALLVNAWPLLLIGAAAALLTIWRLAALLGRCLPGASWTQWERRARSGFDWIAAGVFALVGGACFLYMAAGGTVRTDDPGVALRNASPSMLVLPFLVLLCWKACALRPPWVRRVKATSVQAALFVLAFATVAYGFGRYTTARAEAIESALAEAAPIRAALDEAETRLPGGQRLAVWYRWQQVTEPAGFHFWGNYRYANEAFDEELLRAFPRRALMRMRHLGLSAKPDSSVRKSPTPVRTGWVADDSWINRLYTSSIKNRGAIKRSFGPVATSSAMPSVGAVAFQASELGREGGVSREALAAHLRDTLGPVQASIDTLAGRAWVVVERR